MSEELKPNSEAVKAAPAPRFAGAATVAEAEAAPVETMKLSREFERDDYDGEVDVNNLPVPPWSKDALGEALFDELARVGGVGQLAHHQLGATLDPRSFGITRAKYLIRRYGLNGAVAEAYTNEGAALQEAIDEVLPKVKGTPRNPSAKPLRPAETTRKQSGPPPRQWS